jgi:tetratricopeptide (TPR) repeat protein
MSDTFQIHLARLGALALAAAGLVAGGGAGCTSTRSAEPEIARALRPVPADLAEAEARWRAAPEALDALVWYGRRLAYEGRLDEALGVFGAGLRIHPGDAELLRHRGHRYLSLRRFEEARRDLEQAAAALEGTPDRVEPDGAPNDFGVPRSTLHTNVWYHLGLAYHCLGRDEEAARAFAWCLALATNDDYRVAAAYWRALALLHLGRPDEARALAGLYAARPLELMESFDYAALLALFAGTSERAREELARAPTPLAAATLGYGVAMGERLIGNDFAARAHLMALVSAGPSNAFGRIAAEVELVRLGAEE